MKIRTGVLVGVTLFAFFAVALPNVTAAMQELPEGSYKHTCVGCIRNLDLLTCNCPDDQGQLKPANMHLASCRQEISNRNGRLVCGG